MKIVINKCYGGFSLSDAALHALAARKGVTLYREFGDEFGFTPYYTSPTFEDDTCFSERPEDRTDSDLIAVVEELGEAADGYCARLEVRDLQSGQQYRICEYDGKEWLEFPSDIRWLTAT